MGVLTAVFPDSRIIPLDVARRWCRLIKRRRQQQDDPVLLLHQIAIRRADGGFAAAVLAGAGQHSPRLTDGINLALRRGMGSDRLSVVIKGAEIPAAVPG